MTLNGARIYNEGMEIGHDSEEKIRRIVTAIKSLSPSSDIGMRFLKSGKTYEGLLWGRADNTPIGIYNRGPSMTHVLDTIFRKVNKECSNKRKLRCGNRARKETQTYDHSSMAMAG